MPHTRRRYSSVGDIVRRMTPEQRANHRANLHHSVLGHNAQRMAARRRVYADYLAACAQNPSRARKHTLKRERHETV